MGIKVRRKWKVNPATKVKDSKKIYNRLKEKIKLIKEFSKLINFTKGDD